MGLGLPGPFYYGFNSGALQLTIYRLNELINCYYICLVLMKIVDVKKTKVCSLIIS